MWMLRRGLVFPPLSALNSSNAPFWDFSVGKYSSSVFFKWLKSSFFSLKTTFTLPKPGTWSDWSISARGVLSSEGDDKTKNSFVQVSFTKNGTYGFAFFFGLAPWLVPSRVSWEAVLLPYRCGKAVLLQGIIRLILCNILWHDYMVYLRKKSPKWCTNS